MGEVLALDELLAARTVWRARQAPSGGDGEPTGHAALDTVLPQGGWPRGALTELLLPADGIGELGLLLPALARMTAAGGRVALVAPPHVPYAPAWQAAGVELGQLEVIDTDPRQALWAQEQCLRSGACEAVLGWPPGGDDRALRRLQVAADSGDCCGFVLRDRRHAANASPAALRLLAEDGGWRVLKSRGAQPHAGLLRLAH
ncbi:translesion DNA synthesis-associated protein ImuA [Xanthomonas sp. XNM01]|uniref:translesion DNA synthesis-associated protein ImuA n=1 Tax=Xanthomonas sp. XNM01 TaxID=2769289 RepID=UPI001781499B|nr:translesion DNA synthesis-associated protein ImuA [Xanthomonas sp. XNM01]MBD9368635.1 translesion DNA synthesis-associated protein ImuA [Xanthomonas sp. XNM01]